jgi:hypothetical protein
LLTENWKPSRVRHGNAKLPNINQSINQYWISLIIIIIVIWRPKISENSRSIYARNKIKLQWITLKKMFLIHETPKKNWSKVPKQGLQVHCWLRTGNRHVSSLYGYIVGLHDKIYLYKDVLISSNFSFYDGSYAQIYVYL